jgi:hypothetical protein
MMMDSMGRIAWILPNHDLTQRLDQVWHGEPWQNSIAATLDETPGWDGWDSWEPDRQVDELHKLLAQWEIPADGEPTVEALSEDTSQPRWNPGSGMWEIYNVDRRQWWAHDADSDTWLDPEAQRWVPRHPTGGPFDWVTAEQAHALAGVYGDDWAAALTKTLDAQWGSDWQGHPAEHKQAWLTDLLPTLAESKPAPDEDDGLELEPGDLDFMSLAQLHAVNQK